jgi:hypothetical protein
VKHLHQEMFAGAVRSSRPRPCTCGPESRYAPVWRYTERRCSPCEYGWGISAKLYDRELEREHREWEEDLDAWIAWETYT